MDPDFYARLADHVARGLPGALATVVLAEGSTPVKVGAKALYAGDGRLVAGWLGGGCIDGALAEEAKAVLASGSPRTAALDLSDEILGVGLPCGGRLEVLVEPIGPGPVLEVVGYGRVASALVRLAAGLGFRVRLHAPLPTPGLEVERVEGDLAFDRLAEVPGSYVVVASQHKGDERAIARALERGAAYVGLVASRTRASIVLDRVRELAADPAAAARVRSPAGLAIGAATPEEIALAVLAEVVAARRGVPE